MDFLEQELCHHGIKGQKWGVRRYQNADGSLTAKGRVHWGVGGPRRESSETHPKTSPKTAPKTSLKTSAKTSPKTSANPKASSKDVSGASGSKSYSISEEDKAKRDKAIKTALLVGAGVAVVGATAYLGYKNQQYAGEKIAQNILRRNVFTDVDVTYHNLEVSRITRTAGFNKNHAFFATHEKSDVDFYKGMFGHELKTRYKGRPIYQVKLSANSPINVPSERNASKIFKNLCYRDESFLDDAFKSINHASTQMKRPAQQNVFDAAKRALTKIPKDWTDNDVKNLYAAFNMSLVHHEDFENKAQDAFYSALKQKGYSGIKDLNDAMFSSYHAKDPIILFDTDKFVLQSATKLSNKEIESIRNKVIPKYVYKDLVYSIANLPEQALNTSISKAQSKLKMDISSYM